MSSSSESHVSSSNNHSSSNTNHFTSTSSDEDNMAIFHCMAIACNSHNFFTSHEIEEGVGQSVDARVGVQDILTTMPTTQHLFKSLTNFTLARV
jgi:hypothetical protein